MAFNSRSNKVSGESQRNKCRHCERTMGDYAGGYSRGYNNELLCHPNVSNRPDCYALVTRYNHPTPCDSKTCYEDHEDLMDYVSTRHVEKLINGRK